jgi:hypothetical protein
VDTSKRQAGLTHDMIEMPKVDAIKMVLISGDEEWTACITFTSLDGSDLIKTG